MSETIPILNLELDDLISLSHNIPKNYNYFDTINLPSDTIMHTKTNQSVNKIFERPNKFDEKLYKAPSPKTMSNNSKDSPINYYVSPLINSYGKHKNMLKNQIKSKDLDDLLEKLKDDNEFRGALASSNKSVGGLKNSFFKRLDKGERFPPCNKLKKKIEEKLCYEKASNAINEKLIYSKDLNTTGTNSREGAANRDRGSGAAGNNDIINKTKLKI